MIEEMIGMWVVLFPMVALCCYFMGKHFPSDDGWPDHLEQDKL